MKLFFLVLSFCASALALRPHGLTVPRSALAEAELYKSEMLRRGVTTLDMSGIAEFAKRQEMYQSENEGWSVCAGEEVNFISMPASNSPSTPLNFRFQQEDGNFVVYDGSNPVWSSGVTNQPCANPCDCLLIFQGDGNLVTVSSYVVYFL